MRDIVRAQDSGQGAAHDALAVVTLAKHDQERLRVGAGNQAVPKPFLQEADPFWVLLQAQCEGSSIADNRPLDRSDTAGTPG